MDFEKQAAAFSRVTIPHTICHACGYEPPDQHQPRSCPKCNGGAWERFVWLGKLKTSPADSAGGFAERSREFADAPPRAAMERKSRARR